MAHSREEQLAELTDKLENGIRELYSSGRYAEYLSAMSKFHRYSYGNVLLIYAQCPHATHVASYGRWKKAFGRQVRKGEKGISIFAPCPYKRFTAQEQTDPDTGATLYGPDGAPLTELRLVQAVRFRIETVFDVSQTEGPELPALGVSELTGEVTGYQTIRDRLAAHSPVPVGYEQIPRGAKGFFSPTEQRIAIRAGMSQVQTIKTLVHEIAHAKLHDPTRQNPEEVKQRREKEIEAESVAYVVCQHFGIDTSDYSFGYVAGWSRGKEQEELKASLQIIRQASDEIIRAVEPPEREQLQEPQEKQHTSVR